MFQWHKYSETGHTESPRDWCGTVGLARLLADGAHLMVQFTESVLDIDL